MKQWSWAVVIILAVLTCWAAGAAEPDEEETMESRDWAAFEIDEVDQRRSEQGGPWLEFLRVPTLRTGLYVLSAGGEDRQRPHAVDEVYHVLEGRAVLRVGDDEVPVKPGSVVFVKAGVDHRFHDVEEDLKVLVFFSSASSDQP